MSPARGACAPRGPEGGAAGRPTSCCGEAAALACLFPDFKAVMASEDVREGLASFLERRDAVFKGR